MAARFLGGKQPEFPVHCIETIKLSKSNLLLLLRSNAGMVMSDLGVGVPDELGSSLKFLLI